MTQKLGFFFVCFFPGTWFSLFHVVPITLMYIKAFIFLTRLVLITYLTLSRLTAKPCLAVCIGGTHRLRMMPLVTF